MILGNDLAATRMRPLRPLVTGMAQCYLSENEKVTGEAKVITDWQQKWDALKLLCNASTKGQICREVYGDNSFPDGLPDNFRHWFKSTPTNREFLKFFELIAIKYCELGVTGQALISCSFPQFISYLKPKNRTILRHGRISENYFTFNVDLRSLEGDLEHQWLDKGVVDQRFMYFSRESVDGWNRVVIDAEYTTYEHCKRALERLLKSDYWKDMVAQRQIGTIVILGAGAYTKDVLIVNSVLESGKYDDDHRLRMLHFDSSFYMLADTIRQLQKKLRDKSTHAIELIPCCADFMRLREWQAVIRPIDDAQRVAFFILGNTIGNVNEGALVTAIKAVSQAGDIFVVSAEFAPESGSALSDVLFHRYNKDDRKDLALSSIRNLLDRDEFSTIPEERRALVDVTVEQAERLPGELRSAVPGTMAVVFRTNKPVGRSAGRLAELVLVTSKRYMEKEFTHAMETDHGFNLMVDPVSSPDDENYKHLVFERKSEIDKSI